MVISIGYQKRKNVNLFNKFHSNSKLELTNTQNYIPIYTKFFSLNNTNWNSINLNHKFALCDITDTKKDVCDNVFTCKVKHVSETNGDDTSSVKKVFVKLAPLLDPFKYLVGKYDYNNPNLFSLPSLDNKTHPKILDPNNSSYIDGFFSYLTSKVLNDYNFIHGLDYYGSYLGIKNNFKLNIIDDIDYLVKSDFFNTQKNILFQVEDYERFVSYDEIKQLKPIKISSSAKSINSIKSIDENIFENIFEKTELSLDDMKMMGVDLIDITETNLNEMNVSSNKKTETLKSASTCSSRTSHTNDDDLLDEYYSNRSASLSEYNESNNDSEEDNLNDLEENDSEDDEWESVTSCSNDDSIMLTFPKFPVQIICMEYCHDTLDNLILNNKLSQDEWFSALMQIIMILITYQKMFSFTHNDLHTNNVMYIPTNKKYIYYVYKKKTYKVPTFGKIYKLIDFGRAIYKFDGKIFCSDSFQNGGDAATQYNTEPYYNDKKPRLDPNFSFDLCRLACSIFDYVVDDFDKTKNIESCSPLVKLIVEWCIDDNGINVLYKNNGVERYPDFKLYKMIARCVHKHTPQAQLERQEFSKYLIQNKNVPNTEYVINIDELPSHANN
jgi:hypothetical protein